MGAMVPPSRKSCYNFRVTKINRVVDGDTIDVTIDLGFDLAKKERVRIAGVDTPEKRTRDLEEKALGIDATNWMKEKLEGAIAIHDFANFRDRLIKEGKSDEEIEAFNKQYPMPEHPVIRTHPDTKKKVIYVNAAFTQYIKDWDPEESQQMLNFLYSRASVPEYQCRFAWEDNSIAFWDNRACQHYANSDYWPNVRKVERVTIIGDRPY